MTVSLRDTRFATTKHLTIEVNGVKNLDEAMHLQSLAHRVLETDSVGATLDTRTEKLTLQAFVHSDVDC